MIWQEIALKTILERIEAQTAEVMSLQGSLGSEAKSTAGDKHETGRAMIQIDMERASQKLHEWKTLHSAAQRMFAEVGPRDRVRIGHAVETTQGWFLLGPALGKMVGPDGSACFGLSAASPMGRQLLGKCVQDEIPMGRTSLTLLSIH